MFRNGQPTVEGEEEGSKKIKVVCRVCISPEKMRASRLTEEVENCCDQELKGKISHEPDEVRSRQHDNRLESCATAF